MYHQRLIFAGNQVLILAGKQRFSLDVEIHGEVVGRTVEAVLFFLYRSHFDPVCCRHLCIAQLEHDRAGGVSANSGESVNGFAAGTF